MASDTDDLFRNIENIKLTVRQSFARVYAGLKARELKTLRQLDALRKQCEDDKDLARNCSENIQIRYDNESILLDNVSNYGVIDFEKLNFDSNTFLLEDYVSPNDDHMYSYKTIDELTRNDDNKELEAIEEAAMKEITRTENCVCYVDIKTEDVSKKFRDLNCYSSPKKNCSVSIHSEKHEVISENVTDEEKSDSSDSEIKKIDPTDDWLNSIKNQTETEPTVADAMEHSTITCS
ncbi:unnamed protein product [Diatraea saccharalis]|uniref:Uncharacterized protein n=1 Tax=Diatraea saccharalis TaxID=40085 RepID=A0A9N9W9B4_9NEOP|nr:unnamed protein product [Diatraea saccharalis]